MFKSCVGEWGVDCYIAAMERITLPDLLTNPDYYLFGTENDVAIFLAMNRQSYERSIFFDGRIAPVSEQAIPVALQPLLAGLPATPASPPHIGWIFHMAHTGSTLLARALDLPGRNLVIREPVLLRSLGIEAGPLHQSGKGTAHWSQKLQLALHMLDRRYAPDQPVLVKANVPVNRIIPDLLERSPYQKAVFLHFGLEDYLAAILRGPNHRKWVEHIYTELQLADIPDAQPVMNIGEKAAALWLYQIDIYARMLAQNKDLRSLDANILFDDPLETVRAAAAYFGCPMDLEEAGNIVAGPLFSTYSKNPGAAFDNAARKERLALAQSEISEQLLAARQWVDKHPAAKALPVRLGQALCGENGSLL